MWLLIIAIRRVHSATRRLNDLVIDRFVNCTEQQLFEELLCKISFRETGNCVDHLQRVSLDKSLDLGRMTYVTL